MTSNGCLHSGTSEPGDRAARSGDRYHDHVPRLMLKHATERGPRAGHAREGIWHLADHHLGRLALLVRMPGLRPGIRPACGAATTWWSSGETGRGCTPPCWPRSRWARSRCRCTRTRSPPSTSSRSTTPRCASPSSKTRSRSTRCWRSATSCPQLAHLVRRPARPAQLRRARPGGLDELIGAGARHSRPSQPTLLRRPRSTRPSRRRGRDVLHQRHHRQPQGRGAHPFTLLDRAAAGAELRQADPDEEEVLAYLPPAWIGQNIFSYAQWLACGYVVNCPESPPR
jgi:hypothetical protein